MDGSSRYPSQLSKLHFLLISDRSMFFCEAGVTSSLRRRLYVAHRKHHQPKDLSSASLIPLVSRKHKDPIEDPIVAPHSPTSAFSRRRGERPINSDLSIATKAWIRARIISSGSPWWYQPTRRSPNERRE